MIVDQPSLPQTQGPGAPIIAQPVLRDARTMRVNYADSTPRAPHLQQSDGLFAGASQMAQGLEHVSNFLAGVNMEIGKAKTIKQVDDAENAMTQTQGEFAAWQNTAPADSWQDEWSKRSQDLQKNLLSQDGLTPAAKEAIDSKWNHFNIQASVGVQQDYAKKTFADAQATTIEKGKDIAARGDVAAMDEYTNRPERRVYLTQEQVFHLHHSAEKSFLSNVIATDPHKMMDWLSDPSAEGVPQVVKDMGPGQIVDAQKATQASQYEQEGMMLNNVKELVASGALSKVSQLDEWQKKLPPGIVTPALRKAAERIVTNAVPDLGEVAKLQAEARAFNSRMPDAPLQQAQLTRRISELDKYNAEQTQEILKKSATATDTAPSVLTFADKIINTMHDKEEFSDASGKPLAYKADRFLFGAGKEGGALDDYEKVKAFGINKDQADTLKSLNGEGKLEMFKAFLKQNKSATPIVDQAAYNKLTDFTRKMFDRVVRGGEWDDPNMRNQSGARALQLSEEFRNYINQHPLTTQSEAIQWIRDNTEVDRRAQSDPVLKGAAHVTNQGVPAWERGFEIMTQRY